MTPEDRAKHNQKLANLRHQIVGLQSDLRSALRRSSALKDQLKTLRTVLYTVSVLLLFALIALTDALPS